MLRLSHRLAAQKIPLASQFVLPAIAQELYARREEDKNRLELDAASAVMAGLIPIEVGVGRLRLSRVFQIVDYD